jgi:hypothetical protein
MLEEGSMEKNIMPVEKILLPFERATFKGPWRVYFKIKRECWLATIQRFRRLWELFVLLDDIFMREIDDCQKNPDPNQIVPLLLFIKSHQSIRVAAEVAASTHFSQAYDLARAAIESTVIAHKIHREPALADVWLKRDDGRAELKAYEKAFKHRKKENLFPSRFSFLAALHDLYARFSDWGTHTTICSIAQHYRSSVDTEHYNFNIVYTVADPQQIASSLYDLISSFALIEEAFHEAFSRRLLLDSGLQEARRQFDLQMKSIAARLIKAFKIKGPLIVIPPAR